MQKSDNSFYNVLDNFLLSDWINHPIKSYDDLSELNIDNIVDTVVKNIYDCYKQIMEGHFEQAQSLINKMDDLLSNNSNVELKIDLELVTCQFLMAKYNFSDAFTHLKKIEEYLNNFRDFQEHYFAIRQVRYFALLSKTQHELKHPTEAIASGLAGLEISKAHTFDHRSYDFCIVNYVIYKYLGEIHNARDAIFQALRFATKLSDKHKKVTCLNCLSAIEEINGDYKKGISYGLKGVELARKINSKNLIGSLVSLANCYWRIGFMNEVLPLLLESEQVSLKQGDDRLTFNLKNNLGLYYITIGDYTKGLAYLHEALSLVELTNYDSKKPYIYTNLASLYYQMNELDKAEEYFRKVLDSSISTSNSTFATDALMSLIIINADVNNRVKCQELYEKLISVVALSDGKITQIKGKMAHGFVLEISEKFEETEQALDLFKEILSSESLDFESFLTSYLHYCKTIFRLYTNYSKKIKWESIEEYLKVLQQKSTEFKFFNTLYTSQILESKLMLLKNDFMKAETLILNVIEKAQERGFKAIVLMAEEALAMLESIKFANNNVNQDENLDHEANVTLEKDIIQFVTEYIKV